MYLCYSKAACHKTASILKKLTNQIRSQTRCDLSCITVLPTCLLTSNATPSGPSEHTRMRISYTIRSIQLARAKCSNSKKVRFIHSQRALAVCAHKLKANRLRPSQTMINHHAERGRAKEREREEARERVERVTRHTCAQRGAQVLLCCFVACLWLLLVLSLFLYLPRAIPKWL